MDIVWLIVLTLLILAIFGGATGIVGGYGYGLGHIGVGLPVVLLIALIIMLVLGRQ